MKTYNIQSKNDGVDTRYTTGLLKLYKLIRNNNNIELNNFDDEKVSRYNMKKILNIIEKNKNEKLVFNFSYNYAENKNKFNI